MARRVTAVGVALVFALVALTPVAALASVEKGAANTVAICGCGMVFTPTEKTEYITHDGKSYACCSEGCHQMASKDPAKAAKMAAEATSKKLGQMKQAIQIANLVSVTDEGTKAVCCGTHFTVDAKTKYLEHKGETYAFCGQGCYEHASKDPAKAAENFEK